MDGLIVFPLRILAREVVAALAAQAGKMESQLTEGQSGEHG